MRSDVVQAAAAIIVADLRRARAAPARHVEDRAPVPAQLRRLHDSTPTAGSSAPGVPRETGWWYTGRMPETPAELAAIAHLLPEERVGAVSSVQPISTGLSGAGVYAVTSSRGELVLRVQSELRRDASEWRQQILVWRRAADRGVAPALLHVDDEARAVVCARVAGMPLAGAVADPGQRGAVIGGVVAQLRALHEIDAGGVVERDPLAYVRAMYADQRARPGFPAWAAMLEPIFDAIEATVAHDRRRVVSHNDVNPGNVLWDGTRAWLVDWDVAGLNHPYYDLATLAMFLLLDDGVAHQLLAQQEGGPIDDGARAVFAALRRLVALLCGLMFASMVPDLTLLPDAAPTMAAFYAELGAGRADLQDPRGRGAFALALLQTGLAGGAARNR
jgi:Ser/Thr protein kinase RdoA (MazF antagonist)